MAADLILEIGCEEIPARVLTLTLIQLREKTKIALEKARIGHGAVKVYGTPRRLALAIEAVAEVQEGWEEKRLGPLVAQAFDQDGNPTKAALGFAKSCGVELDDLGREDTAKGEKLSYVKIVKGRPSLTVLAEVFPELIRGLEFPKAMRWGAGAFAFVRPVHWILALLGDEIIEFELEGVSASRYTHGHRFALMGEEEGRGAGYAIPAPVLVTGIADYLEKLDNAYVIPDLQFRRDMIEHGVLELAAEQGGEVYPDPGLVDEVTNLVEHVRVMAGKFDAKYLALPAEVLITAMRAHQRYFAVRKPGTEKDLLPCFIAVDNTPHADDSEAPAIVIRGNERVLAARLADAEFYFKEDLATGLATMREGAAGMVFYKTLGTYLDKMGRVEALAAYLGKKLYPADAEIVTAAKTAARYSKADLVSQVVGSFPDLQGIMGGEYARAAGLGELAAEAIRDHYLPRSSEDIDEGNYPCSPAGDVLSLADKLDSVVAGWAAGLAPTGSGDPFALRRQGQGVINLVLAKGYRLKLPELVHEAALMICPKLGVESNGVTSAVMEFLVTRFRTQLTDSGYPYDVVDACLAVWNGDLLDTLHKVEALARLKTKEDFEPLMIAFRRVMNIIEGEPGPVDTNLLKEVSEATLYSEFTRVRFRVDPLLAVGSYDQALEVMRSLKPSVDNFFNEVLVNTEDAEARRNRHALCSVIATLFKQLADFSRIVIAGEQGTKKAVPS